MVSKASKKAGLEPVKRRNIALSEIFKMGVGPYALDSLRRKAAIYDGISDLLGQELGSSLLQTGSEEVHLLKPGKPSIKISQGELRAVRPPSSHDAKDWSLLIDRAGPALTEAERELLSRLSSHFEPVGSGIALEKPSGEPQPRPGTQELVDRFFEAKKGGLRLNSRISYGAVLHPFARAYPELPLEPETIDRYLELFSHENTTAQHKFNVLRVFYNWLEKRRIISVNPIKIVEKPAGQADDIIPLNEDQVRVLHDAPKTAREKGYVGLMLDHAFRLSEVIRLNVGDVHQDRIWVHGKERKEFFPLLSEVRDCLLELAGGRPSSEPLFKGRQGRLSKSRIQSDIKELLERCGINGVRQSPHTLRHSFATMAYLADCDWDAVELLLRQKEKRSVTNRYIHVSPEQRLRLMREKLEKYSPLRLVNLELGIKPDYTQLVTNIIGPKATAQQLPELLDHMIALGEMAHEIKRALGGNGHWPEQTEEIIKYLTHQASK